MLAYDAPTELPQVLSIDDFRGNAGGQKFQTILTDAKNHRIFDILPSRSQVSLMQYLQEFPNKKEVKYFVMDMNQVYRDLALSYFPNATIVNEIIILAIFILMAVDEIPSMNKSAPLISIIKPIIISIISVIILSHSLSIIIIAKS